MRKLLRVLLRALLGFLILGAVTWGIEVLHVVHFMRETQRNYTALGLRVGMNVREIPWPESKGVTISCGSGESYFQIQNKDEWHDISIGRRTLPLACRKMHVLICGAFMEMADYDIEFDEQWNISNNGPLRFIRGPGLS
jgi:hypothetical protein